jgi:hypothetical protein
MECKDPRHKHSTPERSAACAEKAWRQQRKRAPPVARRFPVPRVAVRGGVAVYVWSEFSSTKY